MTHDKLLRSIEWAGHTSTWSALRAVVELHRPIGNLCLHCGEDTYYPCPTINAIEKELS